eukprot:TRINITY_DN2089_c0_g3_i1.p1 TRINITY_DN2089_c0_g3~~TRINITY_DN2089_c0_g3_i1.p1  ORF type:complete len:236 (+),score=36.34 TRINITY_DN2089_c0_g3_i1:221-928(+)
MYRGGLLLFWLGVLTVISPPFNHFKLVASDGSNQKQRSGNIDSAVIPADSSGCEITGECVPCSDKELKMDGSCKPTGYHQSISCREDAGSEGPSEGSSANSNEEPHRRSVREGKATPDTIPSAASKSGRGKKTKRKGKRGGGGSETLRGEGERVKGNKEGGWLGWRMLFEKREREMLTFQSCDPNAVTETLTIFGFEVLMLSTLLVAAPVMHYRKRRAASSPSSNVNRVPSSSRF